MIEPAVPDTAAILGFALASFCISVSPGPSWLYVISTTVSFGIRHGLVAVAGNGTGILCHATATSMGLALLVKQSATGWMLLKMAGAAWLIWLGIKLLRQTRLPADSKPKMRSGSLWQTWKDGCLVNLLNPKVPVLMLALMPQFVDVSSGQLRSQIFLLGCVHLLIASAILGTLVFISSASASRADQSQWFQTWFQRGAGFVMIVLGILLACEQGPS
ncbi:MAG: LysE family translocator [Planctomycetaceae bacterium]|nr:LysE family translocator [Planctomycetaceae bacterium]